jgi:hypothetical protein
LHLKFTSNNQLDSDDTYSISSDSDVESEYSLNSLASYKEDRQQSKTTNQKNNLQKLADMSQCEETIIEGFQCSICLTNKKNFVVTCCKNMLCGMCLTTIINETNNCPLCCCDISSIEFVRI